MMTMLSRRQIMQGAALSAGAIALLRGGLQASPAVAQAPAKAGTIHSFTQGGVTFHTYVSPAEALSVTSHVVELGDQLLVADATLLPDTASEVGAFISSLGTPIHTAYVSHEHPDHWGGVAGMEGVTFGTLPEVRENLREEATAGDWPEPTSLLNGPDMSLGTTEIGGVPVEFRAYDNNEALKMLVAVFPQQKVAIVQDLVYNSVFNAPGIDRKNWIATLEELRDDEAFDTLLVGHGLTSTRGELTTAIEYLKVQDQAWADAATPEDYIAAMKLAYPGFTGEFLLDLAHEYWDK